MRELRAVLANFVRRNDWFIVETRGRRWVETVGTSLHLPAITSADIRSVWAHFDQYIAEARSEYILTKTARRLDIATELLRMDHGTRRAYVYRPDWYWSRHPACVICIQFLLRHNKLLSVVYIRSSNLYNALPYDIHAVDVLSRYVAEKLGLEMKRSEQLYHIGSAHVPENKWKEFLSILDLSAEEVKVGASTRC